MGKLVTTLGLSVLILGAALYTFGQLILPATSDAGEAAAIQIRSAF